ncbi:hypothetical protein HRbin39_01477 [bacterium HR39]|nr:hypothetical protein HRbin39_01477 [bacterium HR39]
MGQLVWVANGSRTFLEVPAGLVPPGVEAVWFKVQKAGAGDVEIRAGQGMTLHAPDGANPYVLTRPRQVVTVIVTGPEDTQEPNAVYIED